MAIRSGWNVSVNDETMAKCRRRNNNNNNNSNKNNNKKKFKMNKSKGAVPVRLLRNCVSHWSSRSNFGGNFRHSETAALKLPWNCSETALELLWNCSGTALELLWNCSPQLVALTRPGCFQDRFSNVGGEGDPPLLPLVPPLLSLPFPSGFPPRFHFLNCCCYCWWPPWVLLPVEEERAIILENCSLLLPLFQVDSIYSSFSSSFFSFFFFFFFIFSELNMFGRICRQPQVGNCSEPP